MTTIFLYLVLAVSTLVAVAALATLVRSYRLLKNTKVSTVAAALLLVFLGATTAVAQPVVAVEVDKLLAGMPALPASPAEALRRAGTGGAEATYQPWRNRLQALATELANQQAAFYRQYPTGVKPAAAAPNRVSPQAQSSMNDAMAEFAARMQSDPAFAQAFMKKSEAEQQAYIQELLAKKGLTPATPPPGATMTAQPEAEPVNWIELTSELTQGWAAYLPAHSIAQVLFNAEQKHQEIAQRLGAAIEKVPMVEMGEYGRDHDPKQVEALQQKAREEHRAVATRTLEEGRVVLRTAAAEFNRLCIPYQTALRQVNHGKSYDFTIFYANILGQQQWLLQQLDQLAAEAVMLTEHVAQWEK